MEKNQRGIEHYKIQAGKMPAARNAGKMLRSRQNAGGHLCRLKAGAHLGKPALHLRLGAFARNPYPRNRLRTTNIRLAGRSAIRRIR